MYAGRQQPTVLPPRIEAVRCPIRATEETLRLCSDERDALLVSIRLSGCSQTEIAERMGVSKQSISKWLREGIPDRRVRAFCNATGSLLVTQYADLQRAMRYCSGRAREADRIAEIASHSEAA